MAERIDVERFTADGTVLPPTGGSLIFWGAQLCSTGNNAVDVAIHDGTGVTGQEIASGRSQDGSSVDVGPPHGKGLNIDNGGIHVNVTGTAPVVVVYYEQC